MKHPETYMRTIDATTIDSINGAMENLASTRDYFRPVSVPSPLGLFVMSTRSYSEVVESIDIGLDDSSLTSLFDEATSDSVAKEPVAAVPYGIHYPTPGGKSDNALKEEIKAAGYNRLRGIRKVMLEFKPVHEKTFCPPEFKNAARELGGHEFYDNPVTVTIGWTDLHSRREVMAERREEILNSVSVVAPFVLMSAISVEEI